MDALIVGSSRRTRPSHCGTTLPRIRAHYEEDHLISLELGGAPRSKKNLWPEPWLQAHKSDPRENAWHKKVCNGTLTFKQARAQELAYKRKYG